MIVDNQAFSESFLKNTSFTAYEQQLLEVCRVYNDTGDDDRGDIRTISFSYGYQNSEANAVIMAVAAGILSKN